MDRTTRSLVFVYGTLRRDAPIRAPATMTLGWTFVGYGRVRAELYDLGAFPGARPSDDETSWVRGEVYRVPRPTETIPRLDRYEGCAPDDPLPHAFQRGATVVTLDEGREIDAWIYWYTLDPVGRRLEHGDYAQIQP